MAGGVVKRSLVIGVVLGLVVAVGVVAGLVWYVRGGFDGKTEAPPRALLVFESPDAEGGRVAWVLLDVDLEHSRVTEVDTSVTVGAPGTAYALLRDSYSFGGGAALSDTYARVSGDNLPSVVVREAEWRTLIGESAGVTVEVTTPVNVFLGDRLVGFPAGEVVVEGSTACELLVASEYMRESGARPIRAAVAEATAEALRKDPGALLRFDESGLLEGGMNEDLRRAFVTQAAARLAESGYVAGR